MHLLQQRHDDQRQQLSDLRRQLDEMKLVAEDNSTELELRKANDSLDVVRNQLDNSERQVIYQVLRHRGGGGVTLLCYR